MATGSVTMKCECGATTVKTLSVDKTKHTGKNHVENAKEATCDDAGYTGDTVCECGKKIADGEIITAKGHNWIEASCYNPRTCSACGTIDSVSWGHDWMAVVDGTGEICNKCGATKGDVHQHTWLAATCIAPETCTSCGVTRGEQLPHSPVVDPAVAATCTTSGKTEGSHCSACGVVIAVQQTIPAKGHAEVVDSAVPATCTTAGKTEGKSCITCNTVLVAQQTIPAKGHEEVTVPGVAATCTATGKTDGKRCDSCGTVTVAQETIPAKGHDEVTVPGKDATCMTIGQTDGKECATCGKIILEQQIIPAKGHTAVLDPAVEATCTTAGKTEGSHCNVCNTVLAAQQTIAAKGHSVVPDAAVEATCTTDGKTSGSHCTVCNDTIVSQKVIPATGHDWMDATCTDLKTCKTCGATEGTTIPHIFDQEKVDPQYQVDENTYYKSCKCGEAGTETFTVNVQKPSNFKDVSQDAFYYDAVLWAVENGITTGTSATTFSPDEICTRGQVVTFLWRAAGEPKSSITQNPFTDVKESDFFYKAVLWAVENKITTGTGDGTTFAPNENCNRGQIVTFLSRAKGGKATTSKNPFTDVAENAFFYNPVLWAVEKGITTGTGDGTTFAPDEDCTRGQVITFLYRAYK